MAAGLDLGWRERLWQLTEADSARLRELLALGLGLDVDVGPGWWPTRCPAWLWAPALLLLLALLAYACGLGGGGGGGGGRARGRRDAPRAPRRAAPRGRRDETAAGGSASGADDPALPPAAARPDEPRKRARRRPAEQPKPNGRTVEVTEEEVVQSPRSVTVKQPVETDKKNEKSKKNKKKSKSDAKAVQSSSRHDGKEADEGAWETKISHREKRQQRKRDKVQTDSGSLDSTIPGIESTITATSEQLAAASFPVGSKKNKVDSHLNVQVSNFKSGKGDSILQVSSSLNENLAVNGGGWNDKSLKLSSPLNAGEEKWNSVSPASAGKRKAEPAAWGPDPGDASSTSANGKDWGRNWSDRSIFSGIAAWSSVDRGVNSSEQNSAALASLTFNSAVSGSAAEPVSQSSASDYQWDVGRNQPYIDDAWSGLNGLSSADPSSDWNAPVEEWGNWVDEERVSLRKSQETIPNDQKVSDDDKEKGEGTFTTGKSKKKKKKKKKQGEEAQDTEDFDKEIKEELPVNASKIHPKQEKTFSFKTTSTSDPADVLIKNSQPTKTLPPAVSAEPSVSLSKNDSDKSSTQVPLMPQETEKPKSNPKQNSVPPSQTKSETSWESPKQIKKKKKARRET